MGIDLTNFLISFFAEANVMHSLIEDGAKFSAKLEITKKVAKFLGNFGKKICHQMHLKITKVVKNRHIWSQLTLV